MASRELKQRLLVAAIGIPVGILVIRAGGWVLAGVLAAVAVGATLEFYDLASRSGQRPFAAVGAFVAGLLVLAPVLRPEDVPVEALQWTFSVMLILGVAAASLWRRGVDGKPLASIAITVAGALFCGGTLSYAVLLHQLGDPAAVLPVADAGSGGDRLAAWVGPALVAYPLVLTWLHDSFAYFGGGRWGRRKLMPSVSPGKTIEGSLSGLVGTVVVGLGYTVGVLDQLPGLSIGPVLGVLGAILIVVFAQLGDLAESVLKREAEVKDSGQLLPGHGGLLDRFDALFFTIPVSYWFLALAVF